MISRILLASLLLVSALPVLAETRVWRNAEATKSITGRFVKRDAGSVTVLRSDRHEVTIPLDRIHPDDRAWLDAQHPLPAATRPPTADRVLDLFEFGDTRAQVLEKLKTSDLVKITLPETMLARTGLNGVFQTMQKIGGLDGWLYFDWNEKGGLKEVTLQTQSLSGDEAGSRLTPCWKELIELLTSRHGPPIQANGKFDLATIPDASMSPTHLWKLEPHGTIILGAEREGEGCQISIRVTSEDIKPIVTPAVQTDGL